MARPDLVLALHGTVKPEGRQLASALLLAVAARLPRVNVRVGWADVLTPTLTETLTGLGRRSWCPVSSPPATTSPPTCPPPSGPPAVGPG